jgi:hypothetical protein
MHGACKFLIFFPFFSYYDVAPIIEYIYTNIFRVDFFIVIFAFYFIQIFFLIQIQMFVYVEK